MGSAIPVSFISYLLKYFDCSAEKWTLPVENMISINSATSKLLFEEKKNSLIPEVLITNIALYPSHLFIHIICKL